MSYTTSTEQAGTSSIFDNILRQRSALLQKQNSLQYSQPTDFRAEFIKKENPQRRKTMFENVKGYVEKHKDILFTLGLVILIDHFMFKGALKDRIRTTIEGVLKKAENLIENKQGA